MPVKKAVVLINLGSPDSTSLPDVKKYLNEFLMDKRVIDYPYLFRKILVGGIIVPFRTPKSAEAYKSIWEEEGSPLIIFTRKLQTALQQSIQVPVRIAMRYGNPSPYKTFNDLQQEFPELDEVLAIPLYPHYAMSSFETAVIYTKECHQKGNYPFRLNFIKPFYNEREYTKAISAIIQPYLREEYDHILFSYHGVPQRHIRKSDITGNHCLKTGNCCKTLSAAHKFCYRHQCLATTENIATALNIPSGKYSNSFQSRLGKGWLQPFTDKRLQEMPAEGIKKLLIICPAFVSDCLETLEEIAERGKETFIHAGGESYNMIPCLNIHPLWVQTLTKWIDEYLHGNNSMIF